ncbi:hypothetical protein V2J09_005752 [Rumex salicifolius]
MESNTVGTNPSCQSQRVPLRQLATTAAIAVAKSFFFTSSVIIDFDLKPTKEVGTDLLAAQPDSSIMDPNGASEESCEKRLYIGNIDHRISEATLIRLFSPYGKIESEDFLCHTRGPKRGEPRGYAFIQFSSKEEASEAKEKMHGRMACGRPLVVRLASEKSQAETPTENKAKIISSSHKMAAFSGNSGQTSRSAKIAAIKNKLRTLDEEGNKGKKQKLNQNT